MFSKKNIKTPRIPSKTQHYKCALRILIFCQTLAICHLLNILFLSNSCNLPFVKLLFLSNSCNLPFVNFCQTLALQVQNPRHPKTQPYECALRILIFCQTLAICHPYFLSTRKMTPNVIYRTSSAHEAHLRADNLTRKYMSPFFVNKKNDPKCQKKTTIQMPIKNTFPKLFLCYKIL